MHFMHQQQKHHMPSDSVNGLTTYMGPCIRMITSEHKKTASFGNSTSAKKLEKVSLSEYYIEEIGEYNNLHSYDIVVTVTPKEIEADEEYLLIQDATIGEVNNCSVQKGDFVYVVYTLLDEDKKPLSQF